LLFGNAAQRLHARLILLRTELRDAFPDLLIYCGALLLFGRAVEQSSPDNGSHDKHNSTGCQQCSNSAVSISHSR